MLLSATEPLMGKSDSRLANLLFTILDSHSTYKISELISNDKVGGKGNISNDTPKGIILLFINKRVFHNDILLFFFT